MMSESETKSNRKTNLTEMVKQALRDQQCGDLEAAEAKCHSILALDSDNADTLHLLGMVCHQNGKIDLAIDLIDRAIRNTPSNPCYHNTLGSFHKTRSDIEKAKRCFQMALHLKSDYPEALYNLAGIFHGERRFNQALACYRKAVAMNESFPEALNNMAATLNEVGRYGESLECCKKAVGIRSNYSEAYNNMGNAYIGLCKPELGLKCYERAIALGRENAEVLCNLANAMQETGKISNAIAIYEKAIRLNPEYGKAYNDLGTAYRSKRDIETAQRQFEQAIKLAPYDVQGYHNLGNIFYDQGDYPAAITWYEKAISVQPDSVPTYINLGIIFQESGQSDKSLQCFNKALALEPNNSKVHSHLVHELYQRCDWVQIDTLNAKIDRLTEIELAKGQRPSEMPFLSLIRTADPGKNFLIAKGWSQAIARKVKGRGNGFVHAQGRSENKKLTIGYISNNFRNHPTSHLIANLFDCHDRTRFTVNAYSYGEDDGSRYRQHIQNHADKFLDLRHSSHLDAARCIHRDEVDILIDLVGYMRGNRLEICAYRPAPVQVRWLGLAGTIGADFFDYIITDTIVTPEDQSKFYSENFVCMPDTYQINSKPLRTSEKKISRNDVGLPVDGFVYCCFCSSYKIDPEIFRIWMEILKRVPESVLWLLRGNDIVSKNLIREASNCGVVQERIVFAEKMEKNDHLERLKLADIALDTTVVNGAATTSDALWAGVPVLTIKGAHFASRMSASILNAVGLNDLVLENEDAYLKVAVEFGNNSKLAKGIKERLRTNRLEKPLFDTQLFVKNLEKAYEEMWKHHVSGKKSEIIRVNEL